MSRKLLLVAGLVLASGACDQSRVTNRFAVCPPDARPAHDSTAVGDDSAAGALHFVAYGDSRTNAALHQDVVDAFAKTSPQVVLHAGDLWDGYTADQWRAIVTKNAVVGQLLSRNLFLVARGNHESAADMLAFTPTVVRDNQELYAATVDNSFFVSLGMDPSSAVSFLETQLSSPAAAKAAWRFVFSHYPIYSGGDHGASGAAAVEALCDRYHVAIYFSGHDHIYERSHQMFAQKVVDSGDKLVAATGTVYIVTGGGGAPLYSVHPIPSTHTQKSANHFVNVTAGTSALSVKALTPAGEMIDSFTITR